MSTVVVVHPVVELLRCLLHNTVGCVLCENEPSVRLGCACPWFGGAQQHGLGCPRSVALVDAVTIDLHSHCTSAIATLNGERDAALAEVRRLSTLLNTPEIVDFAKAVQIEAAHQRERWGSDHDAGKADADWFWLLGYLAGKALLNPGDDPSKQLHRIVTVAAAACNWHAAKLGQTNMRPGISATKAAGAEET